MTTGLVKMIRGYILNHLNPSFYRRVREAKFTGHLETDKTTYESGKIAGEFVRTVVRRK
jgi:hypothetical protein